MRALRLSPGQRFTCAHCGRCCRRTTVLITTGEAEAYRKAGAGRWFREDAADAEGVADPFEPIPGHAPLLRIRKRQDGTCGFLSPEGLCRIHEVLGADRKPLTCRLFPFRFRQADENRGHATTPPDRDRERGATRQKRPPGAVSSRRAVPGSGETTEMRGHRLTRARCTIAVSADPVRMATPICARIFGGLRRCSRTCRDAV
jgi:Fe-S-cluster containining protein